MRVNCLFVVFWVILNIEIRGKQVFSSPLFFLVSVFHHYSTMIYKIEYHAMFQINNLTQNDGVFVCARVTLSALSP